MGELMIGNVEDGTSDEEIKEFLVKYGFPPFDEIEHVPGDGTHPAVLLIFNDAGSEALRSLQPRIHNIYWKNRQINVQVMTERFS